MSKITPSVLETTFAGLKLRSPIGVGAIGRPAGGDISPEDHAEILLQQAEAGAGYIYVPTSAACTKETICKAKERANPLKANLQFFPSQRFIKASMLYDTEGMLLIVTFPLLPSVEGNPAVLKHCISVLEILKKKKPQDVRLIANLHGYGDLSDSYVDGVKFWEGQGVDAIEVVFNCPSHIGVEGAMEDYFEETYGTRWQGITLGLKADMIENITREVVKAAKVPVGIKLTPEIGFPAILGFARRIRDAGAKFISATGMALTISPPDIYNQGKSQFPFVNANVFCGISGSWLRPLAYKNVSSIARWAPGIDIAGSGGIVHPKHCVEMMMLGARMVMVTTGYIEQGHRLIKQCNTFFKKYMSEQGYQSVDEIIGLGQKQIKYVEQLDMSAGQVTAVTDETKCTNCGVCADQICVIRYMEDKKLKVKEKECTGCGFCLICCPKDAIRLEKIA